MFVKKPWSNSQVLAAVFVIHLQWSSEELEPGTVYIKTTAWTEYDNSFFNNLKTSENNTIYDQIISGLSNSLHYLWPHTHTHTPYLLSVSRCGLWCGWFFREASYCACVRLKQLTVDLHYHHRSLGTNRVRERSVDCVYVHKPSQRKNRPLVYTR